MIAIILALLAICAISVYLFFTWTVFFTPGFSAAETPSLEGKTAIITGANSGLGLSSVKLMAAKGCRIILACRSKGKAEEAIALVKKSVPDADLAFMHLDLSDWDTVKKFAAEFIKTGRPLHILMNNAGIMAPYDFQLSKNGVEMQMAGNHLGHFYLTSLLLPVLEKTANANKNDSVRIVNLSSIGHTLTYWSGIDFEHINNPKRYVSYMAYGQSKLANILFTNHLQKVLDAKKLNNVYVNSVHPGAVSTNLLKESAYLSWIISLVEPITNLLMLTPDTGALTQVYCAVSPKIVDGQCKAKYFVPTATLGETSAFGKDPVLAEKLWDWSVDVLEKKGFSCTW
ncbi:hypothetical protein HDU77_006979 [Chytriomyces hyalinus]|nr:hypothetical protein HDU77_006979 [Chytriomyces hyalinus]